METETPELFQEDELPLESGPPPIIIDRSTLQVAAECPHQLHLIERGFVSSSSEPADVGNAVHAILADAVKLRHKEAAGARELREFIENAAAGSRPDLQPQVVEALRKTYPFIDLLCNHPFGPPRSPEDIIRYDGGEGEHSGQLAFDILPAAEDGSRGPVRLTCESDLIMASESTEELQLTDYKSGHATWTATDVKNSLQFQFYSTVIMYNYPAVNRVNTRVLMIRDGTSTATITFFRHNLFTIQKRLLSAVDIYLRHREAQTAEEVPAWPSPDKCAICPAAQRCKLAHSPASDLAKDPEGYLRQYVAMQSAADRMKASLSVAVRRRGRDFNFGDVAFGSGKPKTAKAAQCDYYAPSGSEDERG